MRTTSPQPVYRSTRDTRNSPLWNPSSKELLNVEEDEAGRLAGFRARFGTGFDAQREAEKTSNTPVDHKDEKKAQKQAQEEVERDEFAEDDANLLDLISSFGQENQNQGPVHTRKGATSKK